MFYRTWLIVRIENRLVETDRFTWLPTEEKAKSQRRQRTGRRGGNFESKQAVYGSPLLAAAKEMDHGTTQARISQANHV